MTRGREVSTLSSSADCRQHQASCNTQRPRVENLRESALKSQIDPGAEVVARVQNSTLEEWRQGVSSRSSSTKVCFSPLLSQGDTLQQTRLEGKTGSKCA